jgi:hypothetical protein
MTEPRIRKVGRSIPFVELRSTVGNLDEDRPIGGGFG